MRPNPRPSRRLAPLLAIPLALAASPASAQQVSGMVFDEVTSAPVSGAEVRLLTAEFAEAGAARTDATGRFTLSAESAGAYVVTASAPGYVSSPPTEVELADGQVVTLMLAVRAGDGVEVTERPEAGVTTAYLFGKVIGRDGERPVDAAEVTIVGATDSVRVLTRWNGRFVAPDVPPGEVVVRVDHLAYATETRALEVEAGRAYELHVSLTEEAIELPGIEVTVRSRSMTRFLRPFYERMDASVGGHFLERRDLESFGPQPIGYAIARLPNVEVRRGLGGMWLLQLRHGCEAAVYIDEMLVSRDGETDILEMSTAEIEGVEMYPGPATIPPEFNRPGVTCAVVIWTRRGG